MPVFLFACFLLFLLPVYSQNVYALSSPGNLIRFNAQSPGTIVSTVAVTGIAAGQSLEGLDFRPADGLLYGLGYRYTTGEAQLYIINISNGVASPVGSSISLAASVIGLSFDFNPVSDRIRVTTKSGNNYRLDPVTGAILATDIGLNYAAGDVHTGATPAVYAIAHANNFSGASTTVAYYFDSAFNSIGIINPPNNGTLNTIGATGFTPVNQSGLDMDIISNQAAHTNTAFLSATVSGTTSNLYSVDLATGQALLLGAIGGGTTIRELAVSSAPPVPVPDYIAFAVTGSNLISFNTANPTAVVSTIALTGLAAGQSVAGLDFRPADGVLYALGYNATNGEAQVYTVSQVNGLLSAAGSPVALAPSLSGLSFDFNPVADRIRVTSSSGNNYRLNPLTGAIAATDLLLNYAVGDLHTGASPAVRAVAYTNSFSGSPSTVLYYFDIGFNSLGIINPPNNGTLNTVGSTGLVPISPAGLEMDIVANQIASTNTGFLSANVSGGGNQLFTVDLASGVATLIGTIGNGIPIAAMAVSAAVPVPPHSYTVFAISGGNLISFNSVKPATILSTAALTGITAGQLVEGLDFRPADGLLYALGYNTTTGQAQLYTISTTGGAASPVGSAVSLPAGMSGLTADFNPVADRLRVSSSNGKNYRFDPVTGTLFATDLDLNYAAGDLHAGATPAVFTAAYSNNFTGTAITNLYFYDLGFNNTGTINPPNNGMLNTLGNTGLAAISGNGLDMDIVTNQLTSTNTAFLSANVSGSANNFYTIDLSTGVASFIGSIGAPAGITEMAVMLSAPVPPPAHTVFAFSGSNLVSFTTTSPGTVLSTVALSGFTAGQVPEGMDFRPANGLLYALGYNQATGEAQVYTVNTGSGVATAVGSSVTLAVGLNNLSFDINPVADRIRVTSSEGNNYRIDPVTGALVSPDLALAYAAGDIHAGAIPDVKAVAYTNNFAGAGSTVLYYFDADLNITGTINPPNNGVLNTIGITGIVSDNSVRTDMDIVTNQSTSSNTAFLSAGVVAGVSNLYTVDLNTGVATLIGSIGGGTSISAMAISLSQINLPVLLTEFTGKLSGNDAVLSWTTRTEINNDYFVVERSGDGSRYTAVSSKIYAKSIDGNSSTSLYYEYKDAKPLPVGYYRLQQIDKDGRSSLSRVILLYAGVNASMRMFPNPVLQVLQVSGYLSQNTDLHFTLTDARGARVRSVQKPLLNGNWHVQLPVDGLAKGIYYLRIFNNNKIIFTGTVFKE